MFWLICNPVVVREIFFIISMSPEDVTLQLGWTFILSILDYCNWLLADVSAPSELVDKVLELQVVDVHLFFSLKRFKVFEVRHMNTVCSHCSLLDALAGCIEPSGVKGTVLVDGQRRPKNFRFMTGYVLQVCTTATTKQ